MENVKCIFCNTQSNDILIRENGYVGIKCPTCNLIYTSPRPALNDIIDLYGHDNANISADSHIKNSFTKTLYARHNLKLIKKHISKGKLLEVGAGAGYFLNEARGRGFEVFGIEFNSTQANFIKESLNIPCEQLPLDRCTFSDEKFDLIYHCDVISHFHDPIAEFQKINRKLNENGFVIFETGNLGDVNDKYFKYYSKFQYPDHLFFFSGNNIKTLLDQTGFELIKIYRFSILSQLFLNRVLNSFKPTKTSGSASSSGSKSEKGAKENKLKQLLKNVYHYIIYLVRYKLGSIMPKKEIPQTILVIGKKKSTV